MRAPFVCVASLIVSLIAPAYVVGEEAAAADSSEASAENYGGHDEPYWRNAFREVRDGLELLQP